MNLPSTLLGRSRSVSGRLGDVGWSVRCAGEGVATALAESALVVAQQKGARTCFGATLLEHLVRTSEAPCRGSIYRNAGIQRSPDRPAGLISAIHK